MEIESRVGIFFLLSSLSLCFLFLVTFTPFQERVLRSRSVAFLVCVARCRLMT